MPDEQKPAALAKWSHIPTLAQFTDKKENRKRVRKNAHTSRRALQLRREDFGAKCEMIADMINDVMSGKVKGDQASANLMIANMMNMSGIMEGFGLNFDAMTDQEPCDVFDEKTKSIIPGHRRRSICEALWDINDLLIGIHKLTLINAQQTNDFITAKALSGSLNELWRDENGVLLNPYFGRIDEEAKDSGEEDPEPTQEEQKIADQETQGDLKKKGIDLEKVKAYVNKKADKKEEEAKSDNN